jgi:SRSO17 transposase
MLPINPAWKEGNMMDLIETTPKMDLAIQDSEHLVEELRAYHAIDSPLFQRREPRAAAHAPLQGLLATVPRKSIEPMVLAVDGVAPKAVRARQSFIREGQWHDEWLWRQHWKEVDTDLGAADGVWMVDGSDVPKQGVHAVGVKRQYCGELGKRANCQAGVLVGYGSSQGYTVLDRRLYVPAEWLPDEAYAERRRQGGLPAESPCKTKPELAQEMIATVVQSPALRCRWVVADEACGGNPGFLNGVAGQGLWYCVEVPHSTRVGEARPATYIPPQRGRGRRPPWDAWWRAHPRRGRCWRSRRRCPPPRGHARPAKKAARGQWWRSLPPCGGRCAGHLARSRCPVGAASA